MIFYDESIDNQSFNDSNSQFGYIRGHLGDSWEDLFNDFQKENELSKPLAEALNENINSEPEEGTLEDAVERYSQNNNSTLTNTSSSTKKKSEKEKKSVQIFSITKEPKGKIEIKDQEEEKPKNELLGKKHQNENHTKFAFDNLVRKIKSKLFGALLIILNKSLEKDPKPNSNQDSKEKKGEVKTECFLKIDQKIILQTNIEENKKLLDSKLRDIFSEKVSTKAMNYSKQYKLDYNKNSLGNGLLADIEDIEIVGRKLTWLDAGHLADALAEDVLGGLVALLGIIPEYMQLSWLDPRHGEHFVAKAQRHQDAADKCLAALGLAGETCQLATGKAGLTM